MPKKSRIAECNIMLFICEIARPWAWGHFLRLFKAQSRRAVCIICSQFGSSENKNIFLFFILFFLVFKYNFIKIVLLCWSLYSFGCGEEKVASVGGFRAFGDIPEEKFPEFPDLVFQK